MKKLKDKKALKKQLLKHLLQKLPLKLKLPLMHNNFCYLNN
jgi:hypothetical protein